jgi:transposase-like protein
VYDWTAIRAYYEAGHTMRECQERFGFANGSWDAAVRRAEIVPRSRHERIRPGASRTAVAAMLREGLPQAAIARRLGLTPATVSHHARALGITTRSECARRYDWSEVQRYYDEGHSVADCRRHFGMANRTFTDAVRRGAIITRPQGLPMADLLVAGRPRCRSHVKGRLLRSGLKAPRCDECGLEQWRGLALALELHHVNGDGEDNRLENLRLLCPNCHSQTENWGGRGKRREAA